RGERLRTTWILRGNRASTARTSRRRQRWAVTSSDGECRAPAAAQAVFLCPPWGQSGERATARARQPRGFLGGAISAMSSWRGGRFGPISAISSNRPEGCGGLRGLGSYPLRFTVDRVGFLDFARVLFDPLPLRILLMDGPSRGW